MYKQIINFDIKKMGKLKGWCLKNVREGFGIPATIPFANAKIAMKQNKDKGTLFSLDTIPTNCAVPVFTDAGVFGHVKVYDHGIWYEDGYKCTKPSNSYKWGMYLCNRQIVKVENTPSVIKVGDSVRVSGQGTANSKGGGAKTKSFNNRLMKVISIQNGRYGCNQYNKMGGITGWFTPAQIRKA